MLLPWLRLTNKTSEKNGMRELRDQLSTAPRSAGLPRVPSTVAYFSFLPYHPGQCDPTESRDCQWRATDVVSSGDGAPVKRHAIPNVCVVELQRPTCGTQAISASTTTSAHPELYDFSRPRHCLGLIISSGVDASQAAAWSTVHKAVLNEAGKLPFHRRLRRTLYASKPLTQDLNYYKMYQPLQGLHVELPLQLQRAFRPGCGR